MRTSTKFKRFIKDYGEKYISMDSYEEILKEIEEMETPVDVKEVKWTPKNLEDYWYINNDREVKKIFKTERYPDCDTHVKEDNCFKTKEEALIKLQTYEN